jgi:hypothetical protein
VKVPLTIVTQSGSSSNENPLAPFVSSLAPKNLMNSTALIEESKKGSKVI